MEMAIIALAIVLTIYWIILLLQFEMEDGCEFSDRENLDEVLEKYNPLIAGCIQGNRNVLGRDIISLIIYMIDKKYINSQIKKETGEDNYRIIVSRDFDKEKEMDEIEKEVNSWFFAKNSTIDLADRFMEITHEEDAEDRLQLVDEKASKYLNSLGANKKKAPILLRAFNNLIFVLSIILVFMSISTNGFSLATHNFEITIGNPTDAIIGIVAFGGMIYVSQLFLIVILLVLATLLFMIFKGITMIRHKFRMYIQKVNGQQIVKRIASIMIVFVIIIIFTLFMVEDKYLIVDEFLICISLLIILTDNLMLKNEDAILKDFYKLKGLKDKIEELATQPRDKKVWKELNWNQYFIYSISFGIGNEVVRLNRILNMSEELKSIAHQITMYELISSNYSDFYLNRRMDKKILNIFDFILKDSANKVFEEVAEGYYDDYYYGYYGYNNYYYYGTSRNSRGGAPRSNGRAGSRKNFGGTTRKAPSNHTVTRHSSGGFSGRGRSSK